MDSDLQKKIAEARQAGHSDDDIAKYLTSDPSVGGKVKEALDAGHSGSDVLEYLAPTPTPEEPGFLGSALKMGKDALEGIGSGVVSTGVGAYNLARKGVAAAGLGNLPEAPEVLRKAAAPTQYDAQGNPTDTSGAFSGGRLGEQAAEFVLPGGAVSDAASAAGKFGRAAEVAGRIGADAAAGAGVTAVQSGGDPEAIAHSALMSGIASGALSTVAGALKSIPTNSIYLKGIKFPTRFGGDRAEEIVGKAIDQGILISKGGANKAEAIENLTRAQRDRLIAQHANDLVDINIVRTPVLKLRQMAKAIGEDGIVAQIDKRLASFEAANGAKSAVPGTPAKVVTSPIVGPNGQAITSTVPGIPGTPAQPAQVTVKAAQQAKDDFGTIAQNLFGKFSPGPGQIRKLLGAGLKEGIEGVIPQVKDLNHDIQNSKLLKDAINKYIDSAPQLKEAHIAALAWYNKPAAIIYGALASPYVRSALAIAKDRMEHGVGLPGDVGRVYQAVPRLAGGAVSSLQGPNQ